MENYCGSEGSHEQFYFISIIALETIQHLNDEVPAVLPSAGSFSPLQMTILRAQLENLLSEKELEAGVREDCGMLLCTPPK